VELYPRHTGLDLSRCAVCCAADSIGDLASASSRVTKGLGMRYYAAKKYGLRLGFDVAKGPEETAFYLTYGSAWP
jgi:hypothetical protein